jgi:xanthine/CO dehydrogenase XdhC/CoxF family maturation factor
MKELKDIILAYDKAVSQNKKTALATVVKVEGSSYRRPGARMLVTEDGDLTGAISGGCLEGDALRKARYAMFQQKNKLEIYETTDEDDGRLGIQLGCNGTVHILFEPIIDEDVNNPVNLFRRVVLQRKESIIATVFSPGNRKPQPGTCFFSNKDEVVILNDQADIAKEGQLLPGQKNSVVKEYDDRSVLYQFIPPPVQLVIVGAGNDAQPLTELACLLGWDIIIVDARPSYGNPERFPKASRICRVKPSDLLSAIKIDEQTAVVVMTHSYNNDITALQQLINTNCSFIGLLGPKKKFSKMLADLTGKGFSINDEVLNKIHGPVGLDIGAETAEEIALSILAEIKAVFSNRDGASLKDRPFEIHERAAVTAGKT